MCVVAVAYDIHPRWPLVLLGNRDERHDRPSESARRWLDVPNVIAGRDLAAGGTWLGVSEHGRLATITNVRTGSPSTKWPASRGSLVRTVLETGAAALHQTELTRCGPFNMLIFELGELWLWSNRTDPPRRRLSPGLYGLANGTLDERLWRVDGLKAGLQRWLGAGHGDAEAALALLADRRPAPDASGAAAAPVFLIDALYGTRCSTVVAVDAARRGVLKERRFDAGGLSLCT